VNIHNGLPRENVVGSGPFRRASTWASNSVAARQLRKLTLQQLGTDTELSAAYLSRIERGETATSIANLIVIATRLDVPLRDLFEDTNEAYVPKYYTVSRKAEREAAGQMACQWLRLSLAFRGSHRAEAQCILP